MDPSRRSGRQQDIAGASQGFLLTALGAQNPGVRVF